MLKRVVGIGIAGALAVVAAPVEAAPVEEESRTSKVSAVAATSSSADLTVATYNICRPMVCPKRGGTWSKRKQKLYRTIAAADPGLLFLQELDDVDGSSLEVARDLKKLGYEYGNPVTSRCQPVECSNQIFYKPGALTPLEVAGETTEGDMEMSQFVDSKLYKGNIKDRPLGYAYFTSVATGEPIATVAMHLTRRFERGGQKAASRAARLAEARGLPGWIDKKSAELGVPDAKVIIGGDVNSHPEVEKDGPQSIFETAGMSNVDKAKKKSNEHYGTINFTKETRKYKGFPPKIRKYKQKQPGPRIDVIFTKGLPQASEWEVFVKLKGKAFDKKYNGSDHNMVRAVVPLS